MPSVNISPYIRNQYFDSNGTPLAGGKLYTYAAGTLTLKATYSDAGGTTPNANPIVLDSAGRAQIYLTAEAYKFILKDSSDNTIWTEDNVSTLSIATSNNGATIVGDVSITGATDISSGAIGLKIGADTSLTSRTNATEKNAIIACPHYTNSEEPVCGMIIQSTDAQNYVCIGGSQSSVNAASSVGIYLAADTTTPTGTIKAAFNPTEIEFTVPLTLDGAVATGPNLSVGTVDSGNSMEVTGDAQISGNLVVGSSDGGLVVGSPTGGNKGTGTINAKAVYDDNVLLTGYVLDKAFNPDYSLEEWKNKSRDPAAEFDGRASWIFDLDQYNDFIKSRRMLPTFEGVESSGDIPSTGAMIQKLWEAIEIQSVHIQQLNDRLKKLENK